MTLVIIGQVILLVLLLIFSAFFSSSETAFFSLNTPHVRRIQESHPSVAPHVIHILNHPTQFLSTILIGNTLVNVGCAAVAYSIAEKLIPHRGEAVAIVVVLLLLLIFGEIGPKRIAVAYPEKMSILYTPILRASILLLTPLRLLLELVTRFSGHLFHPRGHILSDEEYETMVDLSGEAGALRSEEQAMVKGIIRLEELHAGDVMTPRVDLVGVDLNDDLSGLLEIVSDTPVRHLILYRDQLDHAEGILDVRRYLLDPDHRLELARLTPFYVPEAARLDKLLKQFLLEKRRVAIVVDEYGGTAGIISRGDVLEEITGEIDDEFGRHLLTFNATDPQTWMVDGLVSLETIEEKTGIGLEAEGSDRLAGWIATHLERVPRSGDIVETESCKATVIQMRGNRIILVRLEKGSGPDE